MNEQEITNGEELVKAKQEERKQRKNKKQITFLKKTSRFFAGLFVILGIVGCSLMKGWYFPISTFEKFDTERILIVNNNIVKISTLKNLMKDIPISKLPIYMTDFSNLKESILSLPAVENVYIRRYAFPARILIILKEETPLISISPDAKVNPVAVFTQNGRLITGAEYLPLPEKYQTTLVLSYGNKGDDYHNWDINRIREIEKLTKYVETFSGEKLEYIDLRNPDDIYVKIPSVNIRLGKIDEKIYNKIRLIPSILPQIKTVNDKVKYIDLRWDSVFLKLQ